MAPEQDRVLKIEDSVTAEVLLRRAYGDDMKAGQIYKNRRGQQRRVYEIKIRREVENER